MDKDTQGPRQDRIVITKLEEGCYEAEYRQGTFKGQSSTGESAKGALLSLLGMVAIDGIDETAFMPSLASDENILDLARDVTSGPRREKYGAPAVNHGRTARLWSAVLGIDVTPEQVCLLNILQKVSRLQHGYHHDTLADIAGYAANLQEIHDEGRAGRVATTADEMVMASIDRIQRRAAAENRAPAMAMPAEPEPGSVATPHGEVLDPSPSEDGEAELGAALEQLDQAEESFIQPWLDDREKIVEPDDARRIAESLGLVILTQKTGPAVTAYAYLQDNVGANGKPHEGVQPVFQSTAFKDSQKAVSRLGRTMIEAIREVQQKEEAAARADDGTSRTE